MVILFCHCSYSHLPNLLSRFRQQYPLIEFKLSAGDPAQAIEKVMNDEVDVAISAQPEQLPSRLEFRPLVYSSFCDCTHHITDPASDTPSARIRLEQDPFIVSESGVARSVQIRGSKR